MELRKWYFAMNESALPEYGHLIKGAVLSCLKNTTLQPNCLYDGNDHSFLEWLSARNVNIIRHSVSLKKAIMAEQDTDQWKKRIATGAYLRIDIPIVEEEEEFVLYTDADVIFLSHPSFAKKPEFFSVAPEHDPDNWTYANTGSMIMNVPNLRSEHAGLLEFSAARLSKFAPIGKGTYDQGALNAYFEGRWDRLPLTMNWKPYWGVNENAEIVHFHGPKPQHIIRLAMGDEKLPSVYKGLYKRNPEAFLYYLKRFREYTSQLCESFGYIDHIVDNTDDFCIRGWALDIHGLPAQGFIVKKDGSPLEILKISRFHRDDISELYPEASKNSGFELVIKKTFPISKIELYIDKTKIGRAKGFTVREHGNQ
jgi:hypothetical protein